MIIIAMYDLAVHASGIAFPNFSLVVQLIPCFSKLAIGYCLFLGLENQTQMFPFRCLRGRNSLCVMVLGSLCHGLAPDDTHDQVQISYQYSDVQATFLIDPLMVLLILLTGS